MATFQNCELTKNASHQTVNVASMGIVTKEHSEQHMQTCVYTDDAHSELKQCAMLVHAHSASEPATQCVVMWPI